MVRVHERTEARPRARSRPSPTSPCVAGDGFEQRQRRQHAPACDQRQQEPREHEQARRLAPRIRRHDGEAASAVRPRHVGRHAERSTSARATLRPVAGPAGSCAAYIRAVSGETAIDGGSGNVVASASRTRPRAPSGQGFDRRGAGVRAPSSPTGERDRSPSRLPGRLPPRQGHPDDEALHGPEHEALSPTHAVRPRRRPLRSRSSGRKSTGRPSRGRRCSRPPQADAHPTARADRAPDEVARRSCPFTARTPRRLRATARSRQSPGERGVSMMKS